MIVCVCVLGSVSYFVLCPRQVCVRYSIRKKNVFFFAQNSLPLYIYIYIYFSPWKEKNNKTKKTTTHDFVSFLFSLRLTVRVMCTKLKLRTFLVGKCVCVWFVRACCIFPPFSTFPAALFKERKKNGRWFFEREQTNPAIGWWSVWFIHHSLFVCLALVGVPSCFLYIVDDDANAICTKTRVFFLYPFHILPCVYNRQ